MIEEIASCVGKICGKVPTSENQANLFLEDFLKSKGYPALGLELKDMIEICIHYTNLNPSVILSLKFKNYFDENGKIKVSPKIYFDVENIIDDLNKMESYKNIINDIGNNVSCLKIKTGLSILLNKTVLFNWIQVYACEGIIYGTIFFPVKVDKSLVNKIKDILSHTYKIDKKSFVDDVDFINITHTLKEFIKNEKKS